jgi:hypothetical protein
MAYRFNSRKIKDYDRFNNNWQNKTGTISDSIYVFDNG